jgi:REP element-mobilizing transposase RayT
MARLPGIVVPNQPLHIMHRENNRQDIFETEEGVARIKENIAHALSKYDCHLHAYVIMSHHLHLLITWRIKCSLVGLCKLWLIDMSVFLMQHKIELALSGKVGLSHV